MKKKLLIILILLLTGNLALLNAGEKKDPVHKKYKTQIESARRQYLNKIEKIRLKMIADYKKLLKKAIASQKLDHANEIKQKIENLKDKESAEEIITNFSNISDFKGKWSIKHANGFSRTYIIDRKGNVTFPEENLKGNISQKGNKFLLDFNDNRLEELRLVGKKKMTIKHYNPKSNYPDRIGVTGTGVLVK